MGWIKLTAPNGDAVQVSGDQLVRIRIPVGGDVAPGTKAIIDFTNGQSQATQESPDEILALVAGKAPQLKQEARRAK